MISLAIKLLIAHVIGDFVLQPIQWVKDKQQKKHKSRYLYYHVLIHVIALLCCLMFNLNYWLGILVITVTHFIIDLAKLHFENDSNTRVFFVVDQLLHLLVIALVVYLYHPHAIYFDSVYSTQMLFFLLSLLLVTSVSSIVMKVVMSKWEVGGNENESLNQAGKYIGVLERLFVFGFILLNQWSAIGLLITAKSVFRFGDLSRAKDRKLTEYILIGTLLSFGLAILTGLLYTYMIDRLTL